MPVQPATEDSLGGFLRARRGQVGPADVGLAGGARRRVPGLRREEVAVLAGISAEYYLRLEQGKDTHPSGQVLDALARALRLDDDATAYLHRLARPAPAGQRTRPRPDVRGVQQLIDGWPLTPAYVQGPGGDVLAANDLACRLSPAFARGQNPLRSAFCDPSMRQLYPDWLEVTAKTVSGMRVLMGLDDADPELLDLVAELSGASERFRTLWAQRDVRAQSSGVTRMHHPTAGALELRYEKMVLPEFRSLLVAYHADPGSPTAERLAQLAAR